MDAAVRQALDQDTLIDITTTGRKTGRPQRIEIWFHHQDGQIFVTGNPGRRGWYANLAVKPEFTWHFKQSVQRDIPAQARLITDQVERRSVLARMRELEERMGHLDVDAWVERSPLIEVELHTESGS